jgi:hypothetical protein
VARSPLAELFRGVVGEGDGVVQRARGFMVEAKKERKGMERENREEVRKTFNLLLVREKLTTRLCSLAGPVICFPLFCTFIYSTLLCEKARSSKNQQIIFH